jgi:hypothetical protein
VSFEPRTPDRIEHLCEVIEHSAANVDSRRRHSMISELYLLAEDLIGLDATPDVILKARVHRLIAEL